MRKTILAVCFTFIALSPAANAALIIHGDLVSDDTTNFVTDRSTGRMYTRFDAFDLTVAETENAISSGGTFDGWSIATSSIADDYIAAILGVSSTACTGNVAYGTTCGQISNWNDGDFGNSYTSYYDYFGYYGAQTRQIGLVLIRDLTNQMGIVNDYENWAGANNLDYLRDNYPINLLLYKNASVSVPEPSALALLVIGLAGLLWRKRLLG